MNENPLTHTPLKNGGAPGHRKTWMTTIAIVLAVIAIAGIAYSVYTWQQNRQLSSDIAAKNNQIADLQKQKATSGSTSAQLTDPYAGWKTYCDTVEKACFKYPSDWTVSPSNQGGVVSVSLENPSRTLVGNYQNNDTRDGFSSPYYAAAIEDLSSPNVNFKVLGGFVSTTASTYPEYKVVDTSFTTSLTAGQQGTTEDTARFTFQDKHTGSLDIKPMGASGMTQSQAKAWFTSDDATTANLIARSFYLE